MPEINPSKNDHAGNDLHDDPQPTPDGKIDTSDTLVPPLSEPSDDLRPLTYEDRNRGGNERPEDPNAR
jgi:hypothetical protein